MRLISRSSTHVPFFDQRATPLPPPLLALAPPHDVAVGLLVLLARGVAERRHAPRGDRVAPGRGRTLTAAVRVVDGVHRGAAGLGPAALVAAAARLPDGDVLVVRVPGRADRRAAVRGDDAHLARGEPERRALALLGDELDRRPGRAPELC